jgi:hypothetical protein
MYMVQVRYVICRISCIKIMLFMKTSGEADILMNWLTCERNIFKMDSRNN